MVNTVVILNLVIAILSKKYEEYSPNQRGLYYDSIVRSIPRYKYNDEYTGLILAFGPFALIAFIISPIYALLNGDALKHFNRIVSHFFYIPYMLLILGVFGLL